MDVFVGEIRLFAGKFAPAGWLFCNGQVLPISRYPDLFQVLQNTYGGDAKRGIFALPDLRGRVPMGAGTGVNLTPRVLGNASGSSAVTLTLQQMPSHSHDVKGKKTPTPATSKTDPKNNIWSDTTSTVKIYTDSTPNTTMAQKVVSSFGGDKAHNNIQPCVGINYIISIEGEWPSFE